MIPTTTPRRAYTRQPFASDSDVGQGGPRALRLRYLAALAAVLVALVAALAVSELRAARQVIADAMEEGAGTLVEAIARAGENAIRADAQLEAGTAARLLGYARLLRELDRGGQLSDTLLARLAEETGLYRINVFDGGGHRVMSSAPHDAGAGKGNRGPADPGSAHGSPTEIVELLAGQVDESVIGFREGRFHEAQRFAAAVRRPGGGAIVVNVDATEMLAFRQRSGIGRLMQEIGAKDDIAYLVLQDRQGVVLASRGVTRMSRLTGDAFMEEALAGGEPRSRLTEYEGTQVFETVLPFWVDADSRGLIRVALVADAMAVAEARSRRRLAVGAGLLAVVGVALVGWITVRQNLHLLGEAHERIQTYSSRLLEDMADAVVAVDGEGRIAVYNGAAEHLFGVPAGVARGARVDEVLGEGGRILQAALAGERELKGEACQCRTPAGRAVAASVSLSLLRNRDGQVETAVAVIQDLTERRALEADLRRRERLSAMGELASGVAHEVRNPLNAIAVIAQRLQREFVPTADGEEYGQLTGTVRQEVDRVNRIVRQFLELARPPALELTDTDLEALLAGTVHVVESEARQRGVRLELDFADLGWASVDTEQLKQAVLNLVMNAVDAVAGDGAHAPATLSRTVAEPDASQVAAGVVRLAGRRDDHEILIAVEDGGPGIAATQRERIFDLYHTTKPAGTGLGLGLVQRIVAEHGGRIDVDSEVGRGSTFTIHLPLGTDDPA